MNTSSWSCFRSTLALVALPVLAALAACTTTTEPVATGDAGGDAKSPTDGGPTDGSSSAKGSATVTGTLGGQTLAPLDAVALKGTYDPSYPGIVSIFFANVSGLCALYNQELNYSGGALKANSFDLGFTLGDTTATSVVATGMYTLTAHPDFIDNVGWDSYDGACNATHGPSATAATVNLTSVGDVYAGTYDITFTGGDHVTGTFTAPLCTIVPPASQDAGAADGGTACLP